MAELNYAQAGVNREAADRLVEKIALLSKATLNRRVKAAVGGYASLYELDKRRWLAASTDGVGTKLKLAFKLNEHRTVGIDLVAMSVNDLLCVGATPLFFLDYFATGMLDAGVAEQVLEGIVTGCKQAGCALVGGETAEMPDFYAAGEYDLGGFAVGLVDPKLVLPRGDIRPGDTIIGMASSGCHSNGFSLLRKLLYTGGNPNAPEFDEVRARELLTPTKIYAKALLPLIAKKSVKGLAHITGSGFLNVPRMSDQVRYRIALPPRDELPHVYNWVRAQASLKFEELAQTFNLGIGMVAIAAPRQASDVVKKLRRSGESAWIIGEVQKLRKGAGSEVELSQEGETATLNY